MKPLVLTGAIPGLLRRGSPVGVRGLNPTIFGRYVVTAPPLPNDDSAWIAACDYNVNHPMMTYDIGTLTLDLTDPTGRFHALLWLRERGHDLRWTEDEADVLAWSVLSVAGGGLPLKAVLPEWTTPPDYHQMSAARCRGHHSEWLRVKTEPFRGGCSGVVGEVVIGWEFWPESAHGPETGDLGRAAADRAALAARYALRNPDGSLTLPELSKVNP